MKTLTVEPTVAFARSSLVLKCMADKVSPAQILNNSVINIRENHYQMDHLIAKIIVCIAVMFFGFIGIHTSNPYLSLGPGTVIWFFGVNTSGYLIESLLHHKHLHNLY